MAKVNTDPHTGPDSCCCDSACAVAVCIVHGVKG